MLECYIRNLSPLFPSNLNIRKWKHDITWTRRNQSISTMKSIKPMKSNQKSMKWGVDLRAQLGKQGRNHQDEWLKKRRSCNTILDAHIKNLTPKKGSLQLVRLYTKCCFGAKITSKQRDFQSASARNMAFCWQTICSKQNLVNMLLFHDTIHQTHSKICHLQRLLRFHGTSPGIWTPQPPFEIWVESNLFLTSQYVLQ